MHGGRVNCLGHEQTFAQGLVWVQGVEFRVRAPCPDFGHEAAPQLLPKDAPSRGVGVKLTQAAQSLLVRELRLVHNPHASSLVAVPEARGAMHTRGEPGRILQMSVCLTHAAEV